MNDYTTIVFKKTDKGYLCSSIPLTYITEDAMREQVKNDDNLYYDSEGNVCTKIHMNLKAPVYDKQVDFNFSTLYPDWFTNMSLSLEEKTEKMKKWIEENNYEYSIGDYVEDLFKIKNELKDKQ